MKIGWLSYSHRWSKFLWRSGHEIYGIFRNLPHIKPGRWGFYFYGLEFGSRNPGHWFGLLLRRFGLWPW
jgi:hypothetical protein